MPDHTLDDYDDYDDDDSHILTRGLGPKKILKPLFLIKFRSTPKRSTDILLYHDNDDETCFGHISLMQQSCHKTCSIKATNLFPLTFSNGPPLMIVGEDRQG